MNEFHEVKAISDELEANGPYTFFEENDIYDLEYTVDNQMHFRGARVMIACGGPNIFIDTRKGSVELYWGYEETFWYLSSGCKTAVETYFEELYQSISA